jgi:putative redox protein
MSENMMKFSVHSTSPKLKTIVETGKHRFVIDEPPDLGVTDEGVNPLETLLGALVGCENVIASFVAKELGF